MTIVLGQRDWQTACEEVARRKARVAWSWAALRNQEGRWELAALTVRSSTSVRAETLAYDRILIRTEMLSARTAARRLPTGTTGSIRALPEGLEFQPEGAALPVWSTTEPDQHRKWVLTDWPG